MKALPILIAVVLYAAQSFGQGEDRRSEPQPESVVKLRNDPNPYPHKYNDKLDDLCLRYKGITTGGIILSILGGGLAASGGVILHRANSTSSTYTDDNGKVQSDPHQRGIGAGLIAGGVIGMGAGIPMIAIGAAKSKSACGYEVPKRTRPFLQMQSNDNGVGMGLKF